MKKKSILFLPLLVFFLLVPVLSYSAQVSAPVTITAKVSIPFYITCDPYPTTGTLPTEFNIFLDGSTTAIVSPAKVNPNGTVVMWWQIDTLTTGNHTIQVKAVNVQGTVRNESTLVSFSWTQPIAPNITTQPVNLTVLLGQPATFSVVAIGTPNPIYQWQRSNDGGTTFTNIAGATSVSYTTPATVATDNGAKFQVVITNIVAIVTSNIVTLTITVPAPASPINIRLSN